MHGSAGHPVSNDGPLQMKCDLGGTQEDISLSYGRSFGCQPQILDGMIVSPADVSGTQSMALTDNARCMESLHQQL